MSTPSKPSRDGILTRTDSEGPKAPPATREQSKSVRKSSNNSVPSNNTNNNIINNNNIGNSNNIGNNNKSNVNNNSGNCDNDDGDDERNDDGGGVSDGIKARANTMNSDASPLRKKATVNSSSKLNNNNNNNNNNSSSNSSNNNSNSNNGNSNSNNSHSSNSNDSNSNTKRKSNGSNSGSGSGSNSSHHKESRKRTMGGSDRVTGQTASYIADKVIGNGSFGVVFKARVQGTGEVVAIKKVLQDPRFKNRELEIMRVLHHPNVVRMRHCFLSKGDSDEVFLNLVLDYIPETVHRVLRYHVKARQSMPIMLIRVFMYQLARSLLYLETIGVCHRDIKPQNLLVDSERGILQICDFGSAKRLVAGEPNVAYICSRYYRAPELIFGAVHYTTAIDVWSFGCVFAELLLGRPMFPGDSGVDQLVEIVKILGTPSKREIFSMNPDYTEFKFPTFKPHSWDLVFKSPIPRDAADLVSKILVYSPTKRISPAEACVHPFFDELRRPGAVLPNGRPIPQLFDFSEMELARKPELATKLVPEHARDQLDPEVRRKFFG